MSFCSSCGNKLLENQNFCSSCGKNIGSKSAKKVPMSVAVILIAVMIAVVWFIVKDDIMYAVNTSKAEKQRSESFKQSGESLRKSMEETKAKQAKEAVNQAMAKAIAWDKAMAVAWDKEVTSALNTWAKLQEDKHTGKKRIIVTRNDETENFIYRPSNKDGVASFAAKSKEELSGCPVGTEWKATAGLRREGFEVWIYPPKNPKCQALTPNFNKSYDRETTDNW